MNQKKILGSTEAQAGPRSTGPLRVALVAGATGDCTATGPTLAHLRAHRAPGYELEVFGADIELLGERRYDLVHVCSPGLAGLAALDTAARAGLPVVAGCPADPFADATGGLSLPALRDFYARCRLVLSPGAPADRALRAAGVAAERIVRWERGVDLERFHPARYAAGLLPEGRFNVLHAGEIGRGDAALIAESFLIAHDRDPRLHLVLTGTAPLAGALRRALDGSASFVGPVDADYLARLYASADLLLFAGGESDSGQAILEAQASGLPVLAVRGRASDALIEDGRTGCLAPADPSSLAMALRSLARRDAIRDRLATGGLLAVRGRSHAQSAAQLAEAYGRALVPAAEVARAA